MTFEGLPTVHSQYDVYWCAGGVRGQGICRYIIILVHMKEIIVSFAHMHSYMSYVIFIACASFGKQEQAMLSYPNLYVITFLSP